VAPLENEFDPSDEARGSAREKLAVLRQAARPAHPAEGDVRPFQRRGQILRQSPRGLKALECFLSQNLDYDLYSDLFADCLMEILQENLPTA